MNISMKYNVALVAALVFTPLVSLTAAENSKPNIVLILADDLGYGDVSCYNSEAKVTTANLDTLASEGMRFTDAHSPSTVCTPTRYSIMTGRMAFRTGYRGVFSGVGGPCLIEKERLTLPGMLRNQGYSTAMSGKWHIGMTFHDAQGTPINKGDLESVKRVDFTQSIPDSPIHRGFDQFFGTACCPTTDWLYAFIDGDRIPVPPTKQLGQAHLPKHDYSTDNRRGMIAPDFDLETVDLHFLEKSKTFLCDHQRDNPEKPFFLFHSMQAVHLPSFPAKQFQGKTNAGPHGDFIFEMDWIVGELMKTLEELKIADNTIVMFASDNGPETISALAMRRDYAHDGARPWRGVKRDAWEGGHRIPFIVRWPGKVPAGTVSDQLLSLTDVMATCAAVTDGTLPVGTAEDSFNMLPVLLAHQGDESLRPYLLQQTWTLKLSIRKGQWKYLDHQGSGGNDYAGDGRWSMKPFAIADTEPDAPGQLYDLTTDPGETTNLYRQRPQVVAELKTVLDASRQSGRSAPLP
jgi:arylsulfatase A